MDNSIQKFQELLRELFQFETSDLDFGIYRILNYKRDRIEQFIQRDLVNRVEEAFAKHKSNISSNLEERLKEVKDKIIQTLGSDAFTATGDLKEEYKNTNIGKDFLSIKAQKEEADKIDEIKLQVFNDLYNFFSRYYEEGDFIPQYRYSIKGHKYAIPYNGEEVKLYWANYSQYYTKTGVLFRDYTFKTEHRKVVFRITEAKEELGSNKATKERFFVLDDDNPVEFQDNGNSLIVRFQYRELTEEEVKRYEIEGGSNTSKQEKINNHSYRNIMSKIADLNWKNELQKEKEQKGKEDKESISILQYQINRFTAKNTKDYFIHKDLKKFLSGQLDYFIKAEVMDLDILEKERFLDKHITRAKVVREIGEDIIDFLAQIEDFQKRLWEKKKFVIKTEYVITTDRVPEEFYDEIWKSELQRKEWEELGFEIPKTKNELKDKKLPVDTKYFDEEFKFKLIERLTEKEDLDDLLDGLLIKSENFQALNTILEKYKEKVQTIYIDPPFNKESDADYLYNVKYKDSTWASMLENRLRLARELLNERGSIFVRCDYNGNWIVRPIMNGIFGEENFRNEISVRRFKKNVMEKKIQKIPEGLDTIYLFARTERFSYVNPYKLKAEKRAGFWRHMGDSAGQGSSKIFFGKELAPPEGNHWKYSQERIDALIKEGKIILECKSCGYIHDNTKGIWKGCPVCGKDDPQPKYWVEEKEEEVLDSNWSDIYGYSTTWNFRTENSEILLKRVIESTSNEGDLVMDFFLGSGTATAVAHKLGRKWIGVEMGEHFYTVVLPRMKKVLYYDKSGISKEQDVKEKYNEKLSGGFFKYQVVEQYEDTLDNIELSVNEEAQELFKDEYLLKYFLDYETKNSPYFLNVEHLKNPFAYKLKVNLSEVGEPEEMVVDLPETFNYLLGLKVKKIKRREDNNKKYLFILGEKDGKNVAIVWREYSEEWSEEEYKTDKEFINREVKDWGPSIVYVNGQSVLTPKLGTDKDIAEIRYIEPEFKRLMEVAL